MRKLLNLPALLIIAGLATFTLFSFVSKKQVTGEYACMTATEVYTTKGGVPSEIEIAYGDGNVEHIPLKVYHFENRESNLKTITSTLNVLREKGYRVVNSSVAVTEIHKIEVFVLEKE